MSELAGKVVAITGGGTGIGAGIAISLAAEGCQVTVGGRRLEPLQSVAESFLARNLSAAHPIRPHVIDVADNCDDRTFLCRYRNQRWSGGDSGQQRGNQYPQAPDG